MMKIEVNERTLDSGKWKWWVGRILFVIMGHGRNVATMSSFDFNIKKFPFLFFIKILFFFLKKNKNKNKNKIFTFFNFFF